MDRRTPILGWPLPKPEPICASVANRDISHPLICGAAASGKSPTSYKQAVHEQRTSGTWRDRQHLNEQAADRGIDL